MGKGGVGAVAGSGVANVGSAGGCSRGGACSAARFPGTGFFACSVSGNCVVVFSGTLDSGVFEKTGALSLWLGVTGGRTVIARLALEAFGLIGLTY